MTAQAVLTPAPVARPRRPRRPTRALSALITAAVVIACFVSVDIRWSKLADFPQNLVHYLGLMFVPPAWGQLGEALQATLLSVEMAWFGTVIGIVISLPLSFLATHWISPLPVRVVMRTIFGVLRAIPEVVTAILILSVTGLTAFTGALAIAVGSIGTLGKWGYEAMEGVDRGPVEAVRAVGGSRSQVVRWAIWPAAQPEVLAFWLYRFEISVRASAILGLIGAGGIGKMLSDNVQFRIWDAVGMLLIVVIVVTVAIDLVSGLLRRRLITGRWRSPRVRHAAH